MKIARPAIDAVNVETITFVPFEVDINRYGLAYQIARIEFGLAGGDLQTVDVWCFGLIRPTDRACLPDAHLVTNLAIEHDVPCSGEAPVGCATEPPPPRQSSIDTSNPLHLPSVDVRIDHLGRYEVPLGAASLPDGVLSERSATLVNNQPTGFWIDEAIQLEVRPDLAGRPPIGSVFRDPFDGPEPVHVFLVFDVTEVTAPSTLGLANIVVR